MKRIEAWASVWPDGVVIVHGGSKHLATQYDAPHVRVVKLVPYDPRKEAVVREAKKYVTDCSDGSRLTGGDFEALERAVAKLNRPRGKKNG